MRNTSRETIEATHFKPTVDGFVFQPPKPWVFGKAHNYLVNDEQKVEILAVMAPDPPPGRRAAVIGALILAPVVWIFVAATILWAVSSHDEPTGSDLVLMAFPTVVPLLLGLFVALAWTAQVQLAKLAPLIAQLAPTDEQITAADRRHGETSATSFHTTLTTILVWAANALVWAFLLGMRTGNHTLASAPTMLVLFNLLLALFLVARNASMGIRKIEAQNEGPERPTRSAQRKDDEPRPL